MATVTLKDWNNGLESTVAECASICYNSPDKDLNRIQRMKEHKHLATFRFAWAVVKIENISTIAAVQTLRTSFADMIDSDAHLWESQRYVEQEDREFVVPSLDYIDDKETRERLQLSFKSMNMMSMSAYKHLRSHGVKKEDARYALTRAITTDLYIAGNMQMWTQFLNLRLDTHAQWEIRSVANDVAKVLNEKFPRIIGEFIKKEDV
jgi:thymidylate synthase (FAD)